MLSFFRYGDDAGFIIVILQTVFLFRLSQVTNPQLSFEFCQGLLFIEKDLVREKIMEICKNLDSFIGVSSPQ